MSVWSKRSELLKNIDLSPILIHLEGKGLYPAVNRGAIGHDGCRLGCSIPMIVRQTAKVEVFGEMFIAIIQTKTWNNELLTIYNPIYSETNSRHVFKYLPTNDIYG